jgi:hypothetical protein
MYVIGTRHAATVEQIAQITKYGDGQYNPAREVLRYVAAVRKYYTIRLHKGGCKSSI